MPDSHTSQLKRCSDPFWSSSLSRVKPPVRSRPPLTFHAHSSTKRDHGLRWPSIHSPSPGKVIPSFSLPPTPLHQARSWLPLALRPRISTSPKGAADYSPGSAEPKRGAPGYRRPIRKANPALRHIPRPPAASATSPAAQLRRDHTALPYHPCAVRH